MTFSGVSRKWKAYRAYKPSGVDWLGPIPVHWQTSRLKYIFRIVNGSTPKSSESDYWDGDIPWVTPDDLGDLVGVELRETSRSITKLGYESCGTTLVPSGSLVLSTRAPIGHLAVAAVALCTNQGCRSLVFRRPPRRRFFYYQVLAARAELESLGEGSTFKELAADKLASIWLGLPPAGEQETIAGFLDRETAKIDALAAKKERLIELLQEKRAALITHAVTKGLNPSAPTKDAGAEWLGRIPAHWEVKRLVHCTNPRIPIVYGILLPGPRLNEGVPYIGAGDVEATRLRLDLLPRTTEEISDQYRRSVMRAGELVYAIRGSFGNVEVVPQELDGVNLSRDAARIAPNSGIHAEWLCFALKANSSQAQFGFHEAGTAVTGVNIRDLKRVILAISPFSEQNAIANVLKQEAGRIDALIVKVRDHIKRLRDYRAALISAAVTGKIDVRDVVESEKVAG